GRFDRAGTAAHRAREGLPHESTATTDEFMSATLDVWHIEPESARRVSHPAPFPIELPERLIHLYTYKDDVVLDPFMGSGSTFVSEALARSCPSSPTTHMDGHGTSTSPAATPRRAPGWREPTSCGAPSAGLPSFTVRRPHRWYY